MTGTITQLPDVSHAGVIRAEDGSRVTFPASAAAGESETLAVGHRVRFDCDGAWSEATVVHALREQPSPETRLDLRYMGFDQAQNIRKYKFDAIGRGRPTRRFIVTADVALFLKHHVAMQEGPALCLRKLTSDLKTSPECQGHELGNDDLLAYASARALAVQRRARPRAPLNPQRHGPPPPSRWGWPPGPR